MFYKCCFTGVHVLLATSVGMPAVKNFAYYGAGAVLINFLLQMTCFYRAISIRPAQTRR